MKRKSEWDIPVVSAKRKCVGSHFNWVQCDYCAKWRRVPANTVLYGEWSCALNTNKDQNSCVAPQEIQDGSTYLLRGYEIVDIQSRELVDFKAKRQKVKTLDSSYISHKEAAATAKKESTTKKKKKKVKEKRKSVSDEEEEYKLPERKSKKPKKEKKPEGPAVKDANGEYPMVEKILKDLAGDDEELNRQRKEFYYKVTEFNEKEPLPTRLAGAIVDLHLLYNLTAARGGYDKTCDKKLWREIFRALPQGGSKSHTSASFTLKRVYTTSLKEYEVAQNNGGKRSKKKEEKKVEEKNEKKVEPKKGKKSEQKKKKKGRPTKEKKGEEANPPKKKKGRPRKKPVEEPVKEEKKKAKDSAKEQKKESEESAQKEKDEESKGVAQGEENKESEDLAQKEQKKEEEEQKKEEEENNKESKDSNKEEKKKDSKQSDKEQENDQDTGK